eukprot:GHVU01219661.1.p1 GENE.GHVU01219661.1~~GHVU01219661.1.p1  ORF type:complete len:387 (-),score=46.30 GHVU01219661.1:1143-2303(-)
MIVTYVRGCICSGIGISLEQLVNGIVQWGTVGNSKLPGDFLNHYVSATAAVAPDSFRKWLARALDRHDLVQRSATISQKIPEAWFDIAVTSSAALRAWLTAWKPCRVVCADEMGIQYMRRVQKLLHRRGARHVGTVESTNEKEGCTIMVVSETMTGSFGRPQIIFGGTRDGHIARRWDGYKEALVLCSHSHFQNADTCIEWLSSLREEYATKDGGAPVERIAVVIDSAPQHKKEEVLRFAYATQQQTQLPQVAVKFIPPNMTAIMQPADVDFNKCVKAAIHRKATLLMRAKVHTQISAGVEERARGGAGTATAASPSAAAVLGGSEQVDPVSSRLRSRVNPIPGAGHPTSLAIYQKPKIKVGFECGTFVTHTHTRLHEPGCAIPCV